MKISLKWDWFIDIDKTNGYWQIMTPYICFYSGGKDYKTISLGLFVGEVSIVFDRENDNK